MHQSITGSCRACLPIQGRHTQRIREQAELAAIASGFTHPERGGELAVRLELLAIEAGAACPEAWANRILREVEL